MATPVTVRRAVETDVPALAALLVQLGYEPQEDWLRAWACAGSPDDRCLVATVEDRVSGLAHVHRVPFLTEGGYRARLTALVVDESVRSRGVGAALLDAAERLAADMGAAELELTTSQRRERAHRFYERQGYAEGSRHYVKAVGEPPTS